MAHWGINWNILPTKPTLSNTQRHSRPGQRGTKHKMWGEFRFFCGRRLRSASWGLLAHHVASTDSPPPRSRSWSTGRRPASCNRRRRTSGFGLTLPSSFQGWKLERVASWTPVRKLWMWDAKSSAGEPRRFSLKEITSPSLHFHKPRRVYGTVAITRSRYDRCVAEPLMAKAA